MRVRALAIALFLLVSSDGFSQLTVLGSFSTNSNPSAIAINPVTNTVYVANYGSNTVSIRVVGNPASSYAKTGTNPDAIAVNPMTNMVYVADYGSGNVTVLNGATNTVSATVTAGTNPIAIAVDTKRNKIYVANNGSNNVTVIDGATNHTSTASAGSAPLAIAVNVSNGWIYVANDGSKNVTAINPSSLATTTVPAGTDPTAIAVNPFSNMIYVANGGSSNVTVINGANNTVAATIGAGTLPNWVVINPATNMVYVANKTSGDVTVIYGAYNAVATTVAVGSGVTGLAVNPTANQIYVSNGTQVSSFEGPYGSPTTLNLNTTANGVAVNPLNGLVFVVETSTIAQVDPGRNINSESVNGNYILINPATDHAYFLESGAIADFNDATGASTTTSVECCSWNGSAIDPVRNTIYFIGTDGKLVAFDGSAHTTSSLDVGANAYAVAVNSATNTIYVTNDQSSGTVTEVDGSTFTVTQTVPVGTSPCSLALNPVTNLIYVGLNGCGNSSGMSVFDPITTAVTTVNGGCGQFIQVDTTLNKAYSDCAGYLFAEYGEGSTATKVSGLPYASGLATNSSSGSTWLSAVGGLEVRNDITGAVRSINTESFSAVVDPATNYGYTAHIPDSRSPCSFGWADGTLWRAVTPSLSLGDCVNAMGVNPITGRALMATNHGAFEIAPFYSAVPVAITVTPTVDSGTLTGTAMFATTNSSPMFTIQVRTNFKPNSLGTAQLYYQLDRTVGTWQTATLTSTPGTNPSAYGLVLSNVSLGVHTLYTYAVTGDTVSNISGTMFGIQGTQTTGTAAAMVSPIPGKLSSTSTTFTWSQGTSVSEYHLTIGTTLNGNDIADVTTVSTSAPVTLPDDGAYLYVALQSNIGGVWRGNQYVYYAPGTGTAATITSPSTSTLLSSTQAFQWTAGTGISNYLLYLGSTPGAHDIANVNAGRNTSTSVSGIPSNGQTVYVYLFSQNGNTSLHNGYTYYASGTGTPAQLTSPANNTHFTSAIETFGFTSGEGISEVVLQIGSTAGAHDIDSINVTGKSSYQVTNLPTNGKTIYVTLASLNGKTWLNEAYTFTAAGAP